MEHLVEGHLGSYYISDDEPEFIEMYCETCGDYDRIVASWDSYEDNGRVNGLLKYFTSDVLNNREDIDRKVELFKEEIIERQNIITSLLNEIEYNSDVVFTVASDLHENYEISDDEYNKIMKVLDFEEDRQIKMVKHFENDMFVKEKDGKVKVLKLSNNNK